MGKNVLENALIQFKPLSLIPKVTTALTVPNIRLTDVRFRSREISQSLNADASDDRYVSSGLSPKCTIT